MQIKKTASAGSLESSDVLITIEPNKNNKINISINSPFIRQFGQEMKNLALQTLKKYEITSCNLVIQDQGAIDEVLVARIITGLERAGAQIILD